MACKKSEKPSAASPSFSLYPVQKALGSTSYFLTTLWLFTETNFYSMAIPTIFFGFFGALSGPVLTTNSAPSLLYTILRIPITLFVLWINLLVFDIGNQRSPASVEEDRINKPSRPIPSGRITSEAARDLCLILVPTVLAVGRCAGIEYETLLLLAVSFMYNELGGSDAHWTIRNVLVALGYSMFNVIVLGVISGPQTSLNAKGVQWIAVNMLVMLFTQLCDLKDAVGDKLKGRKTAPIVLGDNLARWTLAVPIVIASVACPAFFGLGVMSYMFTLSLGGYVALRTLVYRNVKADKLSWKLWAVWTVFLFTLPLISNPEVLRAVWRSLSAFFCPGETCFDGLNVTAASTIAAAIGAKRAFSHAGENNTQTIPTIIIEGVVA